MEQDFVARTALDEMVESDRNQMLKAMIPYLPASGQQFLSMYVKTQELINTMTLFKNRKNYPDMQPVFPCLIRWKYFRISEDAAVVKNADRSTRLQIL